MIGSRRIHWAALFFLAAQALSAQEAPPDAETLGAKPASLFDDLWTRDHLLGFEAARRTWEDRGLNVDLYYNAYFGWNATGRPRTRAARSHYSHSFDLFVRADTERMGLWAGRTRR